jgi:nitroreductase
MTLTLMIAFGAAVNVAVAVWAVGYGVVYATIRDRRAEREYEQDLADGWDSFPRYPRRTIRVGSAEWRELMGQKGGEQ